MSSSAASSSHARGGEVKCCTMDDANKLKDMIKDIRMCMLCTTDANGSLKSRPMAVNGELEVASGGSTGGCPDAVSLYFFTYGSSHKVTEMSTHGMQCNLAFSHPSKQTYISLSGTGTLIRDRAAMEPRWNKLYEAWFPKGLDEPDIALLKVVITSCEYWDSPSSPVAHAVSFVKAKLTGTIASPGDHKTLTMGGKAAEHKEMNAAATEGKVSS